MLKTAVFVTALLTICMCSYAQSVKSGKDAPTIAKVATASPGKSSSITFHLETVAGIGPTGFSTNQIANTDIFKNATDAFYREEYKGYPQMKNKPVALDSTVEYLYILNEPQFYFQNYVAGIYSKEFLIKKLGYLKYKLTDTVKLSRKPLLCYISIIAGFDANHQPLYMVDANNNGDFADDKLQPVLTRIMDEDLMVSSSQSVDITYLYKGQIKGGIKRVTPQAITHEGKFALSFAFPEFNYLKFDYKGKKYIAISQPRSYESFYTIVPDRPYFTGLGKSKTIKDGQFIKIGDDTFGLSSVADNGNELTLIGDDISGFSSAYTVNTSYAKGKARNTDQVVSRQTGFKAPDIKGVNMNPAAKSGSAISLTKLKGKYVFVDFWSTNCGPCIAEFQYIKRVYDQYKSKNFEIIAVVDERSKDDATIKLLKEHHIDWPNIIIGENTTQIKGYEDINSYPTTYLIDPSGKIIAIDLRADALMNKLKTLIGV